MTPEENLIDKMNMIDRLSYFKTLLMQQEAKTESLRQKYTEAAHEIFELKAQLRANGHTPFVWVS